MATGNKRTVSFEIDAGVLGSEQVERLAKDVRGLAKDGGDAAPVFEQLAQQIERVGEQSAAIERVQKLQAETDQLATSARAAAEAEQQLAVRMNATAEVADAARAQLAAARQEEERLRAERQAQERALALLQATTDAAGRANELYALRVRDLRVEIINLKEQEQAAVAARRQLTQDARAAVAAEDQLATQVKRTAEETAKTNTALTQRTEALKQSQIAAGQLGIDTQNLSAEQLRLGSSLKEAATAANTESAALQELAAQEAEALQIQRAFAEAVKVADAALAEQVATLKSTEAAIEKFNIAQTEAISLGEKDVAANERRLAAGKELVRTDELLSAAQRDLANSRNQERAATLQQAQALNQVAAAAAASLAATRQLTQEAASAGRVLNEAFAATGVRSLQAIEGEISRTESALSLLERRFKASAISAQDLERATAGAQIRLAQLVKEATTVPAGAGVFERISSQISGLANRFGALGATIATFAIAFKPLIDTEVELQRLNRVLLTLTGSQEKTATTIEFLRRTSQAAGQQFIETAEGYSKFAAAAINSGIPLDEVNRIFQSTVNAAGNLGLGVDATGRILNAFGQIASKGVVSMEELRGQLGDALPGALQLTAKALGLSNQELIKLIESGQLLAKDGLPAIAKGMESLASKSGRIDGLVASWNRLVNVIKEAGSDLTSGPTGNIFGTILNGISTGIETVIVKMGQAQAVAIAAVQSVGAVASAVASGDFSNLKQAIEDIGTGAVTRLQNLQSRLDNVGAAATGAAAPIRTVAQAAEAAGIAAQSQATSFTASVDAINTAAKASDGLAKAQTAAANAVNLARTNVDAGSQAWVRAQVDYTNAATAAQVAATAADRLAQAKRTEGEASVALAEIAGNEIATQQARATAAANTAAAVRAQADADQLLAAIYVSQRTELLNLVTAQGFVDEAQTKQLEKLRQTIEAKQADAEKTAQQAAVAERMAQALELQTLKLGDNSKNLDTYTEALARASDEQLRLHTLLEAGLATREQVAAADAKVAEYAALVTDALHDQTTALEINAKAQQSKYDIQVATLELQKSELQIEIQILESQGNSYAALQKKIDLKQLEIKIIEAKVAASLAEVAAQRAVIEAELAELAALGQLTPAKQAEIDARLAGLKVKELEAQAARAQVDLLRQQVDHLRIFGTESVKSYGQASNSIDKFTAAVDRNTSAFERNAEAQNTFRVNKEGFATDTAGNVINAQGVDSNYVISQLTSGGMTKDQAYAAARAAGLIDANGEVKVGNSNSIGEAISKILNQGFTSSLFGGVDLGNIPTLGGSGAGSSSGTLIGAPAVPPAPAPKEEGKTYGKPVSPSRIIRIELPTRNYDIGVDGEDSENAFLAFLQQLAKDAARSNL